MIPCRATDDILLSEFILGVTIQVTLEAGQLATNRTWTTSFDQGLTLYDALVRLSAEDPTFR